MTFAIEQQPSIRKSVQDIARSQLASAIKEILDSDLDRHETVHQVRKRCKKLRGLIRLVRPVFKDYHKENRAFRDAARTLSFVRDAQSIIESLDALRERFKDHIDQQLFSDINEVLATRRQKVTSDTTALEQKLGAFLLSMREAVRRVDDWHLSADGYEAIEGGLAQTYRRGREALLTAYREPSTEQFHEWRKRVKYHWYHLRLLQAVWPEMLEVQCNCADVLSDLLGDDHDLAMLRQTLTRTPEHYGGPSAMQVVIGLIDRRRLELQATARQQGTRLFAEKPQPLVHRLHCYWNSWQETTGSTFQLADELPPVEMANHSS